MSAPAGQRFNPRKIASLFLAVLATVLLAITGYLYTELSRKITSLDAGIQEDALWAVYQLDRETRRLGDELGPASRSGGGKAEADAIALRYDILWSRVDLLASVGYSRRLGEIGEFDREAAHIGEMVRRLEPEFVAIRDAGIVDRRHAHTLVRRISEITVHTERLIRETNNAISAQRADRRVETAANARLTERMILALVTAVVGLLFLLWLEISTSRSLAEEAEASALQLKEALAAADAGNRAKSSFVATVSHEIRTPLNAIIGMSEILREQNLPQHALDGVDQIQRSGQMLLEILNEVLDYSAIENGKLQVERRPFDLAEVVQDSVALFRLPAERKGIRLTSEIRAPEGQVVSDSTRLRQLLLNLVGNAIKFTENGSVVVSAKVAAHQGRPLLRLEVTDTGAGIDPEGVARLFRPFSQVDSTITRRFGGTGLGLSICKGIAEKLGGAVGVESKKGKGSRFWVEFPVALAEAAREPVAPKPEQPALPRLSVLMVEDNATNRMVASSLLTSLGQDVKCACDGREAVEIAGRERFDIIFMDMQMPVLSGIDAAREIRAGAGPNTHTVIVAMTANASAEDRAACFAAGMDLFESKPVRKARLAELVAQACRTPQPSGTKAA